MPFSNLRRAWLALPLRTQLTIWNAVIVFAVALAALLTVRIGLRQMLLKELSDALEDEALEISLTADRFVQNPDAVYAHLESTARSHLRHGWFVQMFEVGKDAAVWSSENAPPSLSTIPPEREISQSASVGDLEYRFVERLITTSQPHRWIRVGSSLLIIKQDVANVTRIILPVMLGLVVLAPLGGYLAARRATAPIRDILTTSRRLHPRRLDERLPVRGVGDELDQLSEEINAFLDEIALHLERNRDFVAHAAHELRSPLAAIMASLEVALTHRRTMEEYEELLLLLHTQCGHLTDLIQQLLLLAESDAGILGAHRESVALNPIVESSLSLYEPLAEERGVAVTSDLAANAHVSGDAVRLRQVINNLLDNAVKFTERNGVIQVRLKNTGRTVTIEVTNSAKPMTEEHRARLFDRFYRGPQARSSGRSTGLGLSICKAIVEAYDGTIVCEPRIGDFVAMVVTLPGVNGGASLVRTSDSTRPKTVAANQESGDSASRQS